MIQDNVKRVPKGDFEKGGGEWTGSKRVEGG